MRNRNVEKQKQYRAKFNANNPNYDRDYQRRYYINNSEKRKQSSKKYNKRLKSAVFELLGNECCRCGFSDPRALQIDHINGGGGKEKKSVTAHYYKYILEKILAGSNEYQLLCANCNWIKRSENNENRV